jgi:hypothetical protein
MKKQFTFNLDALIVVSIIFFVAISFIGYQRYQYSDLLEENVQLQWKAQDLEINVNYLKAKLAQCNELK